MNTLDYHLGIICGYLSDKSPPVEVMQALGALLTRQSCDDPVVKKPTIKPIIKEQADSSIEPEPSIEVKKEEASQPAYSPPASATSGSRLWETWQKEKLLEMKAAGHSPREIAEVIGKTVNQVYQQSHCLKKAGDTAVTPKKKERGSTGLVMRIKP